MNVAVVFRSSSVACVLRLSNGGGICWMAFMLLLVVVFSSMAQIMPLSQRSAIQWQACIWCCSPLHVVFCIKNWKRATFRKKLFCCVCLMEFFFVQQLIFSSFLLKVLLVKQPVLYVTTACKVHFFSMTIEKTTQKYFILSFLVVVFVERPDFAPV